MKKSVLFILFLLLFASSASALNWYDTKYVEIAKLEKANLKRKSLVLINQVYARARKEKNSKEILTSALLRCSSTYVSHPDSITNTINDLRKCAAESSDTIAPILHQLIAKELQLYFDRHRWELRNNTSIEEAVDTLAVDMDVDFAAEPFMETQASPLATDMSPDESVDILTWSVEKFQNEIHKEILASLAVRSDLKPLPIGYFSLQLIGDSTTRIFRPSLYDFLVYEALQNLSRCETLYFKFLPVEPGSNLAPVSEIDVYVDSLYADLIDYHAQDKAALMHAKIQYLDYCFSKSIIDKQVYRKRLEELETQFTDAQIAPYLLMEIAQANEDIDLPKAKAYYQKALDIRKEYLTSIYTQNKISFDNLEFSARASISNIEAKSVDFTIKERVYPDKPIVIKAQFKNANNLYAHVYSYRKDLDKPYPDEKEMSLILAKLKSITPVQKQKISVPLYSDYKEHSVIANIEALPVGEYILVLSHTEKLDSLPEFAIHKFTVSRLFATHQVINKNVLNVRAMDAETGAAIAGASINVHNYRNKLLASAVSDSLGLVRIALKSVNDIGSITIKKGNDKIINEDNIYYYDYSDTKTKTKNYIFIDRPIYRPGQKLYYKVLRTKGTDDSLKVIPNDSLIVRLIDANYKEVYHEKLKTNEFGTAADSLIIPAGGLNGNYQLRVDEDNESFKVEEYKRPSFQFEVAEKIKLILNKDTAVLVLRAMSYAGYPVQNAVVKYDMRLKDCKENEECLAGDKLTDKKGEVRIYIPVSKLSPNKFITENRLKATATDPKGESQELTYNFDCAKMPLRIDVANDIELSKARTSFSVSTLDVLGNKTLAEVNIKLYSLKAPMDIALNGDFIADSIIANPILLRKNFPNTEFKQYMNSSNFDEASSWPIDKLLVDESYHCAMTNLIDVAYLQKQASSYYCAEITAKDEFGNVISKKVYFRYVSNETDPIQLKKDWISCQSGPVYKAGGTAQFRVAGLKDNAYVYYQVLNKDKVVLSKMLRIGRSSKLITLPIIKDFEGGVNVHFSQCVEGKYISEEYQLYIPKNKELDIKFISFRNKLQPGEKEKWTLQVKAKDGAAVSAEFLATLYDKSLDAFNTLDWYTNFYSYKSYYSNKWSENYITKLNSNTYFPNNNWTGNYVFRFEEMKGYNFQYYLLEKRKNAVGIFDAGKKKTDYNAITYGWDYKTPANSAFLSSEVESKKYYSLDKSKERYKGELIVMADCIVACDSVAVDAISMNEPPIVHDVSPDFNAMRGNGFNKAPDFSKVKSRSNFAETALFKPQLRTDAQGNVMVEFQLPESLTEWQMKGFAHTQAMQYGYIDTTLITQKLVAIQLNAPRFLRENDSIVLVASVNNMKAEQLSGTAVLELYDAANNALISTQVLRSESKQAFELKAKGSATIRWTIKVPQGITGISYNVKAIAGNHTDGEESTLPVLASEQLITESLPFVLRAGQNKTLTVKSLVSNSSTTVRPHNLSIEYCSNPTWYAIQALPYLIEFPHECAEQTFARLYANTLSTQILNSSPKLKATFDAWRELSPEAFVSNLEKNQELKQCLIEETPWVQDALSETASKKRLVELFSQNKTETALKANFKSLNKKQLSNGGFVWFDGDEADEYITQYILAGFGRLYRLSVSLNPSYQRPWEQKNMLNEAVEYIDKQIEKDYEELQKAKKNKKTFVESEWIGRSQIQYLYARSYYELLPSKAASKAANYYYEKAKTNWATLALYQQAQMALVAFRRNDKLLSDSILASLKDRALVSDELGMYWIENTDSYAWDKSSIETQAMIIEAFLETAYDAKSLAEMKIWLIRNKQTANWNTTKSTTAACFALFADKANFIDETASLKVSLGAKDLSLLKPEAKPEAGTGYLKASFSKEQIKPELGVVSVENNNSKLAYGAVYFQYFEQLDKVKRSDNNLNVKKQLYLYTVENGKAVLKPITEQQSIKVGDIVTVRMEISTDRDLEYVHLKDLRAAGFEPYDVSSGYKYNASLGYYQNVKDASVNFFFSRMPKGLYVFEYKLRAVHAGDFSNGITTIQCMYAPEFGNHSQGSRVIIK